jgi:hypothetical protein
VLCDASIFHKLVVEGLHTIHLFLNLIHGGSIVAHFYGLSQLNDTSLVKFNFVVFCRASIFQSANFIFIRLYDVIFECKRFLELIVLLLLEK